MAAKYRFCFVFDLILAKLIGKKDLKWFQWKSAQAPKQELPKDFFATICDEINFVYYRHLTSYLISQ